MILASERERVNRISFDLPNVLVNSWWAILCMISDVIDLEILCDITNMMDGMTVNQDTTGRVVREWGKVDK